MLLLKLPFTEAQPSPQGEAVDPRSAGAVGVDFPYTSRTTCYIEVHKDGDVTHGADRAAYERAVTGESRLYAVWPGEWSSHLFVIDDLDEYARARRAAVPASACAAPAAPGSRIGGDQALVNRVFEDQDPRRVRRGMRSSAAR